jgi:hypothetical protein
VGNDPDWAAAIEAVSGKITTLRSAMREDLSKLS